MSDSVETVKDVIVGLIKDEEYEEALYQMRRAGLIKDGVLPLEKGQKVWLQTAMNRWICGMVGKVTKEWLELEQSSWIDHTGEYWSEALQKGCESDGWSSEYQGRTILFSAVLGEILMMGPEAVLPSESIRPSSS